MLVDVNGMPIPEENDLATPSAIVDFAMTADDMLSQSSNQIAALEKPPCYIGTRAVNQGPYSFGSSIYVQFPDIFTNCDWPDMSFMRFPEPGVWHVGGTINITFTAAPSSLVVDLTVQDRRGPRLENLIEMNVQSTTNYLGVGPCSLSVNSLFDVHNSEESTALFLVRVNSGVAGTFTILPAGTRAWAHKVRELSDV